MVDQGNGNHGKEIVRGAGRALFRLALWGAAWGVEWSEGPGRTSGGGEVMVASTRAVQMETAQIGDLFGK